MHWYNVKSGVSESNTSCHNSAITFIQQSKVRFHSQRLIIFVFYLLRLLIFLFLALMMIPLIRPSYGPRFDALSVGH